MIIIHFCMYCNSIVIVSKALLIAIIGPPPRQYSKFNFVLLYFIFHFYLFFSNLIVNLTKY